MHASPPPDEFAALKSVSASIGANRMLIQSAGGNTSIKSGDVMWIKASGTLLAEATDRDIFVPVDLPAMRAALGKGEAHADQPGKFLLPGGPNLRPSIETSLHAVFAANVVMHAHCIHTLAHAVQVDCEPRLSVRLKGLHWAFVAYRKPGANLARAVAMQLDDRVNVIILGNHGVIVAGDTVAQTHALLNEVHTRLAVAPSPPADPNLEQLAALAQGSDYALPADPFLHQLALDPARVTQAISGSLYPDHVIFCGIAATALKPHETPDEAAQHVVATGAPAPAFLIAPGLGVLVRRGASSGALALTRALADVLARVPGDAILHYLSRAQNLELLDWDAEKYRAALNAR